MKRLIEELFLPTVGQQLSDMWRYLGSQRFEIGPQLPDRNRKGQDITIADTALVVSSFWEITGPDGHIVGSADFGPDEERRDSDEANAFYRLLDLERIWIQRVEGRTDGGLHLYLTYGFVLTALPHPYSPAQTSASQKELRPYAFEDDELWRFMPNFKTNPEIGHFVGTPLGIFNDND